MLTPIPSTRRVASSPRVLLLCVAVAATFGPGCSCGSLSGSDGELDYTRCAAADPPAEGSWKAVDSVWTIKGRILKITGKKAYRVAVFAGPVGASLGKPETARLAATKADLALQLGGLGDDVEMAAASLKSLLAAKIPVVFVPGGDDRWPVLNEAFGDLDDSERQQIVLAAGLRRIDLGRDQLAVLPGADRGRYALDEDACGFGPGDLEALREAFEGVSPPAAPGRRRLLSWNAPSGWGLSAGMGRLEVGSPDLHGAIGELGISGGLSAFPRGQGTASRHGAAGDERWMVPRIGASGSAAADGSLLAPGVAILEVGGS